MSYFWIKKKIKKINISLCQPWPLVSFVDSNTICNDPSVQTQIQWYKLPKRNIIKLHYIIIAYRSRIRADGYAGIKMYILAIIEEKEGKKRKSILRLQWLNAIKD